MKKKCKKAQATASQPTCFVSNCATGACFKGSTIVKGVSCEACLSDSSQTWAIGCIYCTWPPRGSTTANSTWNNCSSFPPTVSGYTCTYTCNNTDGETYTPEECVTNRWTLTTHCV